MTILTINQFRLVFGYGSVKGRSKPEIPRGKILGFAFPKPPWLYEK